MIEQIPAKSIITCDQCKKSLEMNSGSARGFAQHGKLTLVYDVLDFSGAPAASAKRHYDLCDECLAKWETYIDKTIRSGWKGEP